MEANNKVVRRALPEETGHPSSDTRKELLWPAIQFSSVVQSCPTLCDPRDCSIQASMSITSSQSLLKLLSMESVMPSNHLILCASSSDQRFALRYRLRQHGEAEPRREGYTVLPLVARGGASTSPGIPPPHPTPAPSLGPEGAWSRLEVVARPTRRLRTEHNGRAWALGEFPFSSSSCRCSPKCVGLWGCETP